MINESKLKEGTLSLGGTGTPPVGGVDFACQATNVRLAPTFNDSGDEVETLCGDKLLPDTTTKWSMQGTSIQDFDNADGFVAYAFENNLETVPFTWTPNTNGTSWTGEVQVRAVEIGGDVNARLTSDFDWPCQGDPVPVWGTGATATATNGVNKEASKASAAA